MPRQQKIMDRHKGPKLLTINCNYCNRKIHATMKQFIDGMECPGCGMPVTVGNDDNSTFNSFMHRTQCVNCRHEFNIPIQFSFKYLAVCPQCDALFIRKNLIFDSTPADEESEAVKLLETLYPSIPNNLNNDISDSTPASRQELQLLKDLNIKADAPPSRIIQRVSKQIFDLVNLTVMTHFPACSFFDYRTRSRLYLHIAKSPLLRKIYFDQFATYSEVEKLLREGLGDQELFNVTRSPIDTASYEIAISYIISFAKVTYNLELKSDAAKMLALRAFGRGFGQNIRKAGYLVYHPERKQVRPIASLSLPAMKSFYTQSNPINDALHKLFAAQGYARPKSGGCLTPIVVLGGAGLLLRVLIGLVNR
ncbi:MAG: hypothetical protein PHQ27_09945 [Victivallales bacterium]|nr:hypothetical protein [Victivallales bacterium]